MKTMIRLMLLLIAAFALSAAKDTGKKSASGTPDPGTVTLGAITALDAKAMTMTVGDKTFVISPKCVFVPSGKKEENASIAEYKVGDNVNVTYVVENGKNTVTILAHSGAKEKKSKKKGTNS